MAVKLSDTEEREIFKALKKHWKGYWYYTVTTAKRRNGQMKVSESKYKKLFAKYGTS